MIWASSETVAGLLQFLEKILAAEGCGGAEIAYNLETVGTSAFELLIRSYHWPLSGPRLYLFAVDGAIMFAPWPFLGRRILVSRPACELRRTWQLRYRRSLSGWVARRRRSPRH